MTLDDDGVAYIVKEEGVVGHPYWPGGASGVTLDVGYDLGQTTGSQFAADWATLLEDQFLRRLAACCGVKGGPAGELARDPTIRSIVIPRQAAMQVFQNSVLPRYCQMTEETFPGLAGLCPAAQTALTSLVYNRGSSLEGDRRSEMRAIVPLVAASDYGAIASQLIAMGDRLWPGNAAPNPTLRGRRHREAALVISCQQEVAWLGILVAVLILRLAHLA